MVSETLRTSHLLRRATRAVNRGFAASSSTAPSAVWVPGCGAHPRSANAPTTTVDPLGGRRATSWNNLVFGRPVHHRAHHRVIHQPQPDPPSPRSSPPTSRQTDESWDRYRVPRHTPPARRSNHVQGLPSNAPTCGGINHSNHNHRPRPQSPEPLIRLQYWRRMRGIGLLIWSIRKTGIVARCQSTTGATRLSTRHPTATVNQRLMALRAGQAYPGRFTSGPSRAASPPTSFYRWVRRVRRGPPQCVLADLCPAASNPPASRSATGRWCSSLHVTPGSHRGNGANDADL